MKKKVLALLLAVLLAVGTLPMAASAEEEFVIENGRLIAYNGPGGDVVIPEGVTTVATNLLSNDPRITSITVPGSMQVVSAWIGNNNPNMTSITFNEGVQQIVGCVGAHCEKLDTINFPSTIHDLAYPGALSFADSPNIRNVNIAPGNTSLYIEDGMVLSKSGPDVSYLPLTYLFRCVSDKSGIVKIPEGVTDLSYYAFLGYSNITGFQFPSTLKTIFGLAFSGCTSLTTLEIPEGITNLEVLAFNNIPNLKTLKIPSTIEPFVETFPNPWFDDVTLKSLQDIYYNGTKEEWLKVCIDADKVSDADVTVHCTDGDILPNEPDTPTPTPTPDPDPEKPPVGNFTDVPAGEYYAEPVKWAVENKITQGETSTTFAPNKTCTRGQIVTFLWRANGEPEPASTANPFVDVKSGEYYYKAMLWAKEKGITSGIDDTHFAPDAACNRAQAVTFLWRANNEPASSGGSFSDVKNGEYYTDAVKWAVQNGITNGETSTTFAPNKTCTRGQIVTFLYRDKT